MEIFEPQRVTLMLSGLAMVALALALLALDFTKRANRIFAAFLSLRGLNLIVYQLIGVGSQTWGEFITAIQPYFLLPLIPLAVYFASVYPRPRGPLAGRGGGWITIGVIVVFEAAYFVDHGLYHSYYRGPPPSGDMWLHSGLGLSYSGWGPLVLLGAGIASLVFATIGFRFALDYTHSKEGTQRISHFLVAMGFIVDGAFAATRSLATLARFGLPSDPYPLLPFGWTFAIVPSLAVIPIVGAVLLIARHRFGTQDEKTLETRFFVLVGLAVASALAATLLVQSVGFDNPYVIALMGFWRLILPLAVTYALLRYSLFDIDIRVHKTLALGVVLAIFGGVYLITSEIIENVVADRWGNRGGLIAAAGLTFVIGPLKAVGRRAANVIMPGIKPVTATVDLEESHDIYRNQFLMLVEDGQLTDKERRSLETLRTHLGIDQRTAQELESVA